MFKRREQLIIKLLLLLLVIGTSIMPTKIAFAVVQTTGSAVSVNQSDFTFDAKTGTITKYTGSETEVVIPSKINGVRVTSIGDYAFWGCRSLTNITIPNSVTSIGQGAFMSCESLKSIIISDNVTSIGDATFDNCYSLTSITIPDNVTSIGNFAFYYCTNLTSVTIPNSVTNIGQEAFGGLYGYCENALFYVKSESAKQLLINKGIDESKIILNGSASIVKVTGVTLNKATDVLKVGITDSLSATIAPANATNKNVTWSTSNSKVATVDSIGKVTGVGVGTATITATTADGKKTASCSVTVTSVFPVTGVTLNKATDVLKVGITDSLSATIAPANATNKNVTWSTSNSKVAKVDSVGKVTGVGVGIATITATTADGKKTASCSVTVTSVFPVTRVTLNKTTDALKVGITDALSATVSPANATNKNVTWSTSNSKVATVDKNGKVTAVGAGTATITATTVDGNKTANCSVTVTNTLTLTASYTSLYKTDSFDVSLIDPKYGKQATLAPNQTVIVVAQNGDWYNIKTWLGNAWINIKNQKGIIGVNGVTLNNKILSVVKGKTATLIAVIAPSNASNKALTWKSNNTVVATVDSTGKVTGVAAGTATITCTSNDGNGKSAACTVTVTNPVAVTGVTLNSKTLSLVKGNTGVLTAAIVPSNAYNKAIKWTSSNEKVVTVNNGVITAVGVGAASITATTVDGNKVANCSVTVTNSADQVIFKDKNLEQAIRKTINKPTGILYKSDVINITKLISDNNGILSLNGLISNISGIENLTNLQYLDLGHNEIVDISALKGLTNLQTLNLSHNEIGDINPLKGLTNLKDLDLSWNRSLSDISVLNKLTKLQTLNLNCNEVNDINALKELTNLQTISLLGNEINNISSLSGLTKLQKADLSGNYIYNVSDLSGLINLQTLDISTNQIKDVSPLKKLTNLKSLYLGWNPISDISALDGLSNLQTLNLYYTKLNNVALSKLPSLQSLNLAATTLNNVSLSGLSNLQSLDLSVDGSLGNISLSKLPKLNTLDLGRNGLSNISTLKELTSLQTLVLDNNNISDISALKGLTNLQTLNLNFNPISNANKQSLKSALPKCTIYFS